MEEKTYPKQIFLISTILSALFFAFFAVSSFLFLGANKPGIIFTVVLIFVSIYLLACSAGIFLSNKLQKRFIYSIITNSILAILILGFSGFFIYTSLLDRFKLTSKILFLLIAFGASGILAFTSLNLKSVKKYFEEVDPGSIHLGQGFFGRFFQKTGIKIKLATMFTFVLIIIIAIISFIFILRQKDTILAQTGKFCTYATQEVAIKVRNYLETTASDKNFSSKNFEQDMPTMLKKYSKSMMINGFHSASIEILWKKFDYFRSFTLFLNNNVKINKLSEKYGKEILFKNNKPTILYFIMQISAIEYEKFKEELKYNKFQILVKNIKDKDIKKEMNKQLAPIKTKINNYEKQINDLNQKIKNIQLNGKNNIDNKYFNFAYPVVISARERNPVLINFEEEYKNKLEKKYEEKIEKQREVFFDDNNRLKKRWQRNRYHFNLILRNMKKQNEHFFSKVFKTRISKKVQEEYDENIKKQIKKAVEDKIKKEKISENIPVPKLVGLAKLKFNKSELYKPIYASAYFVITIAIIILIVGMFIIVFLAIKITGPIQNLIYGVNQIKTGNLNFDIELKSRDELGFLTNEFNEMVVYLKENKEMQKFVSKETVNMIKTTAKSSSEVKLGGERKDMTLFFSDIRGFTAMSETMAPEDVVGVCNTYLDSQSIIVEECGGDIDKYVGDELMARFTGENHIQNSIRAAIKIQKKMTEINKEREQQNLRVVQVGIGLNSGEVIVGSMGSKKRMDFTAIGDTVNLAARLCSAAEGGHVLVSKIIFDNAGKYKSMFTEKEPIKVKGKVEPIQIFDIPKPN